MGHEVNLIPADIIEREQWQRSLLFGAKAMFLGMVGVLAIWGLLRLWTTSLSQAISGFDSARATSQPQAIEMKERIGRLEAERERFLKIEQMVQGLADKHSNSLILTELSQAIPPRVHLTRLEVTAPDGMVLQGRALSNTELADFLARLNRSAYFSRVELKYSRRQENGQEKFVIFEIKNEPGAAAK